MLFLAVLAVSFLVSYYIARRLSIPIQRLFISMKKVEMGNLQERSAVSRRPAQGDSRRNAAIKTKRAVPELRGTVRCLFPEGSTAGTAS